MSGPALVNFGCRLNIAEGESLRASMGDADAVIINSCAVTAEAERQTRQAIRRAARERPHSRILVTGCAARLNRQAYETMPGVSAVIDRADRGTTPAVSGASHARAFIEVQNGCDHRCTFCIIPYARGDSRSIAPEAVLAAVAAALERGQQEIILTGVDLTSYGSDLTPPLPLGKLVGMILSRFPALPRLRLSSVDAAEVDETLFDLLAHDPRMMPYLHLSLQHGHDMMLKRMKRRHSRAQAVDLVERLKAIRPDFAIGADLIAGFPTETAEMAAANASLIQACDIVFAHVFPFSPRQGTPAALMPQLDRALVKARADALRREGEAHRLRWLQSLIGTTQRVLIELDGQSGHAENFARVRLAEPIPSRNMRGHMTQVHITGLDGMTLTGSPA